jgi:hypothetical protein
MKRATSLSPLKPLDIPHNVNVYEAAKLALADDFKGEKEDSVAAGSLITAVNRTLDHFEIPPEKRSETADVIMRFGMMIAVQDDSVSITSDDVTIHRIADMYEYMNSIVDEMGEQDYANAHDTTPGELDAHLN